VAGLKKAPGRGLHIIKELVQHIDGRLEQSFGLEGSTSLLVFPL
jgi:hypothetical protein